MQYAPVMIPTLNRYEHFKRCIESLSQCTWAEHTEVYVGLDYPPLDKYVEGYNKIKSYLKTCGNLRFKAITVIERQENIGAVANWQSLQEMLFERYDRICCSEDDNEFSNNFLVYINKGLELYQNNTNVYAICGYSFPIDLSNYMYNYYLSQEMCAWGYATWRDRYRSVSKSIRSSSYLSNFYTNLSFFSAFKDISLLKNLAYFGKDCYEDVFTSSYIHLSNMFVVSPTITKVKNWGHDGSGVNSSELSSNNRYSTQILDDSNDFFFDAEVPLVYSHLVKQQIENIFDCGLLTKIRRILMFITIKLFLKLQNW